MKKKFKVLEKQYLVPFILFTSCYAFRGLANDITNPMVQAAFYGYRTRAFTHCSQQGI